MAPVSVLQRRSRFSPPTTAPLHEATKRPSAENATALTSVVWPSKLRSILPLATSQSRTVRSKLPERARRPSALKHTELTRRVCPDISARSSRVLASTGDSFQCDPLPPARSRARRRACSS